MRRRPTMATGAWPRRCGKRWAARRSLHRALAGRTETGPAAGTSRAVSLADLDAHYHFARRIAAERVAMNHASRVITSTRQERMEQYGHAGLQGCRRPP